MEQTMTPSAEISRRIAALQQQIQTAELDAVLIIQRIDLFYFSGTAQNGYLFIPAEGKALLMIKKYLPRARKETSIQDVVGIDSVKEVPERIVDFYGSLPKVLGLELDVLPVKEFHYLQRLFGMTACQDASTLIFSVRSIKADWEIEQMRRCAELSAQTFDFIYEQLRPGVSEIEFSGIYEAYQRSIGHQGLIRSRDYQNPVSNSYILSGTNGGFIGFLDSPFSGTGVSASFPCGAGMKTIEKHEPILVDIGFVHNGYHIDETRMFSMGAMPDKALRACEAAIDIQNTIIAKAGPGIQCSALFEQSVRRAHRLGYEAHYLGPPHHKVSFVGHGIGLELVEPPYIAKNRSDLLMPGMTFAIEPKMICENEFSAGIESVVMITANGCTPISVAPSKVYITSDR